MLPEHCNRPKVCMICSCTGMEHVCKLQGSQWWATEGCSLLHGCWSLLTGLAKPVS